MVDEGQAEDEAERDDNLAHGNEHGEDKVPIRVVDLEPHDFEEVHGEQRKRAGKGNQKYYPGKSVSDLFLHEILGHDGVAEPACGSYGEYETQGGVEGADGGQVLESVGDAHARMALVKYSIGIINRAYT